VWESRTKKLNTCPTKPNNQNRLRAVPEAGLARLTSLASLRLSDNALTTDGLPWGALGALQGLTALSLDGNALERLPAALGGCTALVRLAAGRNRLALIEPGALGPLSALRELRLESNALPALPDDVGGCTALEELDASANALAALPASMTALAQLHTCRLDDNRCARRL
jgi:Leucine-rich repeat (LRR) protein